MQRSYQPVQGSHYDQKQINYQHKTNNYDNIRLDHTYHRDTTLKTNSNKYSQNSPREVSYEWARKGQKNEAINQIQKENGWESDLRKKLNKLKQQFEGVPNWQGYARSILFESKNQESSYARPEKKYEQKETRKYERQYDQSYQTKYIPKNERVYGQNSKIKEKPSCRTPQNLYSRTISQKYFQQNNTRDEFLAQSNISFKIKETSSIEESMRKTSKTFNEVGINEEPPVNQFQLYSGKHLANHHKSAIQKTNDKVDERIQMISRKIRECEQKKKKLNLEVPDRSHTPTPNKTSKHMLEKRQRSYTRIPNYYQQEGQHLKHQKSMSKFQDLSQSQDKIYRLSKPPKYPTNYSSKKSEYDHHQDTSPKFASFQTDKYFPSEKTVNTSALKVKKNDDHQYQNKTIFERGDQAMKGIQNRKRIRSNYEIPNMQKRQIKRLVQKLAQQTKIDEEFKNNKLWLKSTKDKNKWENLRALLSKEDIRLTVDETEKLFELSQEEDNPFFSVNSYSSDLKSVVDSFIRSEDHWAENIQHKFSSQKLKEEGFQRYSIDLDKKNVILLEDLVRFLNMETGTFFRNRDLLAIFKRISTDNKITYQRLMKTLCC